MVKFGQIWSTIWSNFVEIWSNLIKFGQISKNWRAGPFWKFGKVVNFGQIWPHFVKLGLIQSNLVEIWSNWVKFREFEIFEKVAQISENRKGGPLEKAFSRKRFFSPADLTR